MKQSKIFVSTYNAITFLESLSMNIPTIMFWDNPESAARHFNKIWNNVDLWWDSKEVKVAVETFKNYYSCNLKN